MAIKERKTEPGSRSKGPEVLAHFGAVLATHLCKEGVQEHKASEISLNVMDVMKLHFGGQLIYFPQGVQLANEQRAFEMLEKFEGGASISELAAEYQNSVQWVYKLIKAARDKRREQRRAGEGLASGAALPFGKERHDA